jgi:hypothetical protein
MPFGAGAHYEHALVGCFIYLFVCGRGRVVAAVVVMLVVGRGGALVQPVREAGGVFSASRLVHVALQNAAVHTVHQWSHRP